MIVVAVGFVTDHAMGLSLLVPQQYNNDKTLEFPNSFYFSSLHPDVDEYLNAIREDRLWVAPKTTNFTANIVDVDPFGRINFYNTYPFGGKAVLAHNIPLSLITIDRVENRINFTVPTLDFSDILKYHMLINPNSPDYLLVKNIPQHHDQMNLMMDCPRELRADDNECNADDQTLKQWFIEKEPYHDDIWNLGAHSPIFDFSFDFASHISHHNTGTDIIIAEVNMPSEPLLEIPLLGTYSLSDEYTTNERLDIMNNRTNNKTIQHDIVLIRQLPNDESYILQAKERCEEDWRGCLYIPNDEGYILYGKGKDVTSYGLDRSVEFNELAVKYAKIYTKQKVDQVIKTNHESLKNGLVDLIEDFDRDLHFSMFTNEFYTKFNKNPSYNYQFDSKECHTSVTTCNRVNPSYISPNNDFTNAVIRDIIEEILIEQLTNESELKFALAINESTYASASTDKVYDILEFENGLYPYIRNYVPDNNNKQSDVAEYSNESEIVNEEILQKTEESNSNEDTFQETADRSLVDEKQLGSQDTGGCLIATAAYGSELAPQVQFLREIRDNTLLSTTSGMSFMSGFNQVYYSFSPAIADLERESLIFRDMVRTIITPSLYAMGIMTFADSGSEISVLTFGILSLGVIFGIYVAGPLLTIFTINRIVCQEMHFRISIKK